MINQIDLNIQAIHYSSGYGIANASNRANLTIAPGSILDSTGSYQIVSNSILNINIDTMGIGGIDKGTKVGQSFYYIYVVADSVGRKPTQAIISLSSIPLMPFGYDKYALIGYTSTADLGVSFLEAYWTANNNGLRKCDYVLPWWVLFEIAIPAGSPSLVLPLTRYVPPVERTMVFLTNIIDLDTVIGVTVYADADLAPYYALKGAFYQFNNGNNLICSNNFECPTRVNDGSATINVTSTTTIARYSIGVCGYSFAI